MKQRLENVDFDEMVEAYKKAIDASILGVLNDIEDEKLRIEILEKGFYYDIVSLTTYDPSLLKELYENRGY